MRRSSFVGSMTAMLILGLALPATLAGQSLWEDPADGNTAGIEWMRPDMKIAGMGGASSAAFLFGRYAISPMVTIQADLPLAYGSFGEAEFDDSAIAVGNPLLGARIQPALMPVSFDISMRLPFASINDDGSSGIAYVAGIAADLDRMEAFTPDLIPLSAHVNYAVEMRADSDLRFHAGPVLWLNREDDPDIESTWWFLTYGGELGHQVSGVRFASSLTGRYDLSADDGDFGDRTIHQLGVAASYKSGNMRPGVFVRVPLDEGSRDLVGFVIGVGFSVALP